MASEDHQLHIFMFPFTAQGHTIPIVDLAKLFASRGVKITIVTTPLNSISISKSLHKSTNHAQIELLIIKFPFAEVGLPENCELATSITLETLPKFFKALNMLESPLEKALLEKQPHCLISDVLFPWTADLAAKVGIPRLVFQAIGSFCICAAELLKLHQPYKNVSSDSELFSVPFLPGDLKFTKLQIPIVASTDDAITSEVAGVLDKGKDAESKSFGTILNSFQELERDYLDCHRNTLGKKVWHLGPVSLCNKEVEEKAQRGRESAIDKHECLKWLNSKKPRSVVFLCFGSMVKFSCAQLKEMANGLETSGKEFIWVVAKKQEEEGFEEWLAEGFEEKMKGKGLIIRGWAPQIVILEHPAIGGFVNHGGWNSLLEAAVAGIPLVTWPFGEDHMLIEKLVTQVLKIGVAVGVKKIGFEGEIIKSEAIEKAISRIMEGSEAEEMRRRVTELAIEAKKAVAEDGSSTSDLNALIQELKSLAF